MPPIGDPAALAAEVYKNSKKAGNPAEKPPVGVSASDAAYVDTEGGSGEVPAGEAAAAQGMISAMKKGDAGAMARSMKDFVEICYPGLAEMAKGEESEVEEG